MRHKSGCAVFDWPLADECDCGAARDALQEALEALGVMPDGYCFCFGSERDPRKPDHEHTGECRVARSVLSACGTTVTDPGETAA